MHRSHCGVCAAHRFAAAFCTMRTVGMPLRGPAAGRLRTTAILTMTASLSTLGLNRYIQLQ